VLIRSLRAVTDSITSCKMAQMNKTMSPNVETVFMFSNPRLFFSSSHLIKGSRRIAASACRSWCRKS